MSAFQPETDDELLSRMHGGDEEAFVALYRRRQAGIYRFALTMSGSETSAEDITQEVFLALIREGCGYDPARGSLVAYLYGIARKLVLRHTERGRFDATSAARLDASTAAELAAIDDPLIDLTRQESVDALRRAVLALPKRYREVVVLCDLEEVDYAEAAQILRCPIGTVRSRLHRARSLLLEKLQTGRHQPLAGGALKPARCLV